MAKAKNPAVLTHLDESGQASMVDVSAKASSLRVAVAEGRILLGKKTLALIRKNEIQKGDVLSVARIAGIQAAKQTQALIPLCHQVPLSKVSVDFAIEPAGILIQSAAKTVSQTGVEMEALTAASIAALTIYDMCKAVDKDMRITDMRLVSKTKFAV
ncbi:MAG: cyclic pyranopterin monophosphate synthase MoaC [Verrucomicrobiaceae bacterium]|nr:cyclic pyranopterin monophosphate synthase MoaC [Verrucomicrobiaceae bacterium]